jgi:hypothetical protein
MLGRRKSFIPPILDAPCSTSDKDKLQVARTLLRVWGNPNLTKIALCHYVIDAGSYAMIWRSVFSPVTKRHIERQILHTHPLHLLRIIQDVDQYSRYGVIPIRGRILRTNALTL